MSLLFETILIKNKKAPFLHLHEKRLNLTRKKLFNRSDPLKIEFKKPKDNHSYRLRVNYSKDIENLQLLPYTKTFKKKVLVVEGDLNYRFKFSDRKFFDDLKVENSKYDDFLIVKKGLITDTTIANCSFFDGNSWFTPSTPLLKGTTRERLIRRKFFIPKKITLKDLHKYTHIGFCNALSGFYVAGEIKRILHVK